MLVVRGELKIPCQFAGIPPQRDYTIGKEIITRARGTQKSWSRIANTPVKKIKGGIIGSGHKGWTSAGSPCLILPCLVTALTGARDRVEFPLLFARCNFVGLQNSSNFRLSSGYTYDDGMIYNEGRNSHGRAVRGTCHLGFPNHSPVVGVDGNQVSITTSKEKRVPQNCEAPIYWSAAKRQIGWKTPLILPNQLPRSRIQRHDSGRRLSGEYGTICHKGACFESWVSLIATRLVNPSQPKACNIGNSDFTERAVSPAIECP